MIGVFSLMLLTMIVVLGVLPALVQKACELDAGDVSTYDMRPARVNSQYGVADDILIIASGQHMVSRFVEALNGTLVSYVYRCQGRTRQKL